MTRLNALAAAALALGLFACDRNEKTSETNTTSAQPVPVPMDPVTPAPVPAAAEGTLDQAKDGGHVNTSAGTTAGGEAYAKDGGHVTSDTALTTADGPGFAARTKDAGATRTPEPSRTVAPGHITTPPDRGPGTGAPNSNGSHNIGSGGSISR